MDEWALKSPISFNRNRNGQKLILYRMNFKTECASSITEG